MKRARRRRGNQGELPLKFWGGWRKRPKPSGPERIKHRRRASLYSEHPVHVTLRAVPEVGSLRAKARYAIILKTIRQTAAEKKDFAIVHFSVQGNHLHLIVEAVDARALGRGMQRLNIRIGVRLNRLLHRKGRVFRDRYFRKDLASPKQTRFCIAYVLQNFRKHENEHGRRCPRGWLDPCSSSPWFESWSREPVTPKPNDSPPVASPRTWFLRQGWLAHGPISPDEIPGYQW